MQIDDAIAFVLHTRPWRETSLLVEVLTDRHGRIGVIARGVQGPKRHVLRAALQPLQHIRLSAQMRGELGRLVSAEALDAAPRLTGEAMLSAFYVNELMLRLVPRQDPQPDLFVAYAKVRARLAHGAALGWTLRRFERDLLDSLGFGVGLDTDGDGEPIDPVARYRLDPEHGARRLLSERGSERQSAPTGQALLAFAADTLPEPSDLADLRRAMRQLLSHHLGPRGLKSWEMLAALPRTARSVPPEPGAAS
jgi:DNA repair protein RecO (recombination protein O)